ncbi:MAG: helix-turn-helix transcriptional regulator [Candidatus Omnitrophica bacterium]|nr:helix-turn-helix transcriptional regulator [Candidatus Omnitrophota bacterium]
MGSFGEFFKEKRISLGKTLRQFCLEHELDAGNISKIERGKMSPPQSEERLEELATFLEIKKGSDDWQAFMDFASVDAGKIPTDVQKEEELMSRLPVFFRTLKDKKLSEKELDELIDRIKES